MNQNDNVLFIWQIPIDNDFFFTSRYFSCLKWCFNMFLTSSNSTSTPCVSIYFIIAYYVRCTYLKELKNKNHINIHYTNKMEISLFNNSILEDFVFQIVFDYYSCLNTIFLYPTIYFMCIISMVICTL